MAELTSLIPGSIDEKKLDGSNEMLQSLRDKEYNKISSSLESTNNDIISLVLSAPDSNSCEHRANLSKYKDEKKVTN